MRLGFVDYSSGGLSNATMDWLGNISVANVTGYNKSCLFNISKTDPIVDDFSIGFKVVVGLLYAILGIVGIVGNVAILVVLCKNRRQRLENPTNFCLANVAVIDLFYFFMCHPLIMWNLLREGTWKSDDRMCQVIGGLNCMVYLIGCYSLSLVSLERQLNLQFPAKPRLLTNSRAKIFLACLWTFSFSCAILPIFGINKYVVYRNPLVCGPGLDYGTWQVIIMTGGLMMTFLVVVWSQGILFLRVIRYKRERRAQVEAYELRMRSRTKTLTSRDMSTNLTYASTARIDQGTLDQATIQANWNSFLDSVRVAFTVFIVCSTYIVAFIFGAALGTGLTMAYQEEQKSCTVFTDLNLYAWTVVVTMYMSCFAANPYIYGLRNNDIEKDFKSILESLNPRR